MEREVARLEPPCDRFAPGVQLAGRNAPGFQLVDRLDRLPASADDELLKPEDVEDAPYLRRQGGLDLKRPAAFAPLLDGAKENPDPGAVDELDTREIQL